MTLEQVILSWSIGLSGVSLILGSLITHIASRYLHLYFRKIAKARKWEIDPSHIERIPFYPFATGVLERVMFTILIAFQVPGVGGAMFGWIAIKMAAGWNRVSGGETHHRMLAFTGLLSSLISMLFAVVGGLLCNGQIPIYQLIP